MLPYISVIIPTYNRKDKLKETLESLFNQSFPKSEYEIIVVDDGSTDGTYDMVRGLDSPCELRILCQENRGANASRNLGVENAKSDLLFFTGDDIVSTPVVLEEHLKIQQSSDEDIAVSGKTMGWPDFEGTPYLRHSRRKSALNHIFMSRNKDNLPFNFLTTTNCTIRKKNIIEAGFFDEDLSKYGWQDIEFGYRLKSKAKVTLKFAEKAIAYHHHYVDFSANCKRLEQVGRAAVIVYRKHPDLKTFLGIHLGNFLTDALFFPKGYTTRAFLRLISRLEGRGPRFLLSVCYELVFNHYYLKGVREGFEIEKERGDREKQRSISSAETSEE